MNLASNPFESRPTARHERRSGIRELRPKTELVPLTPESLISHARKLDDSFARVLISRFRGGLEQVHKDLDAIDVMTYGKVKATGKVEEPGINQIEKRIFIPATESSKGAEPVEAFVKSELGEATYGMDNGVPCSFTPILGKDGLIVEEISTFDRTDQYEDGIARYIERASGKMDAFIDGVAADYGLPPEEVPYRRDRLGFRSGIDIGQSTRGEYTTGRIDRLCGLDVVPLTVLRKGEYGLESVQQKAEGRRMNLEDWDSILKKTKEHPSVKSLMRVACLDYLVNASDRHPGNLLFDEKNQNFVAIDNGLNLGLSKNRKVFFIDKETLAVKHAEHMNIPMDGMYSIPIQITELRVDWRLDNESWQIMKDLYDDLYANEQLRAGKMNLEEEAKLSPSVQSGETMKYLTELFRFQFGHDKIADKERSLFLDRLCYLVDHHRPPSMRDREDFHIQTMTGDKEKKTKKN